MKEDLLMKLLTELNEMWHCFQIVPLTDETRSTIVRFHEAKDHAHEILSQLSGEHEQVRKLAMLLLQEVRALKEIELENRLRTISIRYASILN